MVFNLRRTLVAVGCAGLLLLTGGAARAQVAPTSPPPPPDKPVLDALPPLEPTTSPRPVLRNEYGEPERDEPRPTQPGQVDDGFRPARPAQPTQVPTPAARPMAPTVGTPAPAPPAAPPVETTEPKWFVGGNPTLGFNSSGGISYFNAGFAGLLGYRLNDKIAVGPGLTIQYASYSGTSTVNYGARAFGQFLITEAIFAHVEHEVLQAQVPKIILTSPTTVQITPENKVFNSSFAGLGYRQYLGARSMLDIMVLYNFNRSDNYRIYGQPEFRFNLLFNLNWK